MHKGNIQRLIKSTVNDYLDSNGRHSMFKSEGIREKYKRQREDSKVNKAIDDRTFLQKIFSIH